MLFDSGKVSAEDVMINSANPKYIMLLVTNPTQTTEFRNDDSIINWSVPDTQPTAPASRGFPCHIWNCIVH